MALRWLQRNNTYYSDTTIDHNIRDQLPQDSDLAIPSITLQESPQTTEADATAQLHSHTYSAPLSQSFVAVNHRLHTEEETVWQTSLSYKIVDLQFHGLTSLQLHLMNLRQKAT